MDFGRLTKDDIEEQSKLTIEHAKSRDELVSQCNVLRELGFECHRLLIVAQNDAKKWQAQIEAIDARCTALTATAANHEELAGLSALAADLLGKRYAADSRVSEIKA